MQRRPRFPSRYNKDEEEFGPESDSESDTDSASDSDSDCDEDEDEGPEDDDFYFGYRRKAGKDRKNHWKKLGRLRKEMHQQQPEDLVVYYQQEPVGSDKKAETAERGFYEGRALI